VLLGLFPLGMLCVYRRLRSVVASPALRVLTVACIGSAAVFLMFVVGGILGLPGLALYLTAAWLGVDQLVEWAGGLHMPRASGRPSSSQRHFSEHEPVAGMSAREVAYRRDAAGEADGSYVFGLILEQSGNQRGAEAAYRRADQRGHSGAPAEVGRLLEQRGDIEGAIAGYRRGVSRHDPVAAAALRRLVHLEGGDNAASFVRGDKRRNTNRQTASASQSQDNNDRGQHPSRSSSVSPSESAWRDLRDAIDDAASSLGPPVERYLAYLYGPDWLSEVNGRRKVASDHRVQNGETAIRPLQPGEVVRDPREALSLIGYEPALGKYFGPAQADARRLRGIANGIHHHHDIDRATIEKAHLILADLCRIAQSLPSG